jgi:hypothetical protein
MSDEFFQPASPIPESGIYQVLHYRHRLYNDVVILEGEDFPACSECGSNVRFRLVRAAPRLELDRNFQNKQGVVGPE